MTAGGLLQPTCRWLAELLGERLSRGAQETRAIVCGRERLSRSLASSLGKGAGWSAEPRRWMGRYVTGPAN